MAQELLATLRRIAAIAHHYSQTAAPLGEIADAFKAIVDEAGEAIAKAKGE